MFFYNSETTRADGTIERVVSVEAAGLPVATIRTVGTSTPEVFATHTDHLRSTRLVTSEGAGLGTVNVVEQTDYDPFGKITRHEQSGDFAERKKFTSHEFDQSSGYTYAKARYLNTEVGRFLSQDPAFLLVGSKEFDERYNRSLESFLADPQLSNSYSYARNNPLKFTDPDGENVLDTIFQRLSQILNTLRGLFSNFSPPRPSVNVGTTVGASTQIQRTTTWDAVTDRRIQQLDPRVQQPATDFINEVGSRLDTRLRVTDSYRTFEEQNKLYERGISPARGGESYHNYGRAIDVAVMEDGKAYAKPITEAIGRIGEAHGFEWGGRWSAPRTDPPHFEMSFGQPTRDLMINMRNR